jgi:hypothetical protein
MKTDRLTIQRQWYINYAMYSGNQYLQLVGSGATGKLRVADAPPYRVRNTVNLVRPMIRTEISRLTSQRPTATVIPASGSDDDMLAAQGGEAVWEYLQQRRNFQALMIRNAFWTCITGTSFIKTWWDKSLKDPYTKDEYGRPIMGDVCFGLSTPFNIFVPDLLEEEIEDQPFVFEAYTRSKEWVKRFYNLDVDPNVTSKNEIIESSYFQPGGNNESKPDAVLVIEAWIKPGACPDMPEGGLITLVGEELTEVSDFYSHMEYPYSKFVHIPTGKFYADSIMVDINPLQRRYNRSSSQITESKNRMARPQLLVAEGSMNMSKYTSEPGLLVPYRPGLPPPSPLPLQALPSYVIQEMDTIRSEMEDISGQHQASRGMSPGGGVVAATAISFIQEKDDSLMAPTYSYLEMGVEKIARQSLQLVVDYYDIKRTITVTSVDQAYDSMELKGADISAGTDIRVEGGSALPMSKPARQAFLMDLYKMGAITKDEMLDMLEMGGVQKLVETIRVDKKKAQRENLKMKKLTDQQYQMFLSQVITGAMQGGEGTTDPKTGRPLVDPMLPATYPPYMPVNDFDNHAIHIEIHDNFRKGQEFETLPKFIQDEFAKHVQLHQNALQLGMMGPTGQPQPPMPPPDASSGGAPSEPGAAPGETPDMSPLG